MRGLGGCRGEKGVVRREPRVGERVRVMAIHVCLVCLCLYTLLCPFCAVHPVAAAPHHRRLLCQCHHSCLCRASRATQFGAPCQRAYAGPNSFQQKLISLSLVHTRRNANPLLTSCARFFRLAQGSCSLYSCASSSRDCSTCRRRRRSPLKRRIYLVRSSVSLDFASPAALSDPMQRAE